VIVKRKLTLFYDPLLQVLVLVRFAFRRLRADNSPYASAVSMTFFRFIRWPGFGRSATF